jgi:D-alanyl-D-alanine carboxypeptidase/D-alanyl-D-alanine-endopeptidase (penicillin-binding protein 4)
LTRLLETRGVDVGRGAATGTAPGDAVEIAKAQSPPVSEIVAEVIRASDNLGAELLTREIGLRQSQQGTTAAGTQAIVERLASLGVPTTSVALVDGSGLDRGNQVTCQALERTVDLGASPEYAVLWDGLAVAGQSGTLIDEMRGTPLEGKVRAKTGSLDGVTGLVGIVDVGRPLRFAFVANGEFTERGGVDLRDRMAEIIARFPDAPTADALVPAP